MIQAIRNRLQAMEQMKVNKDVPDLVIIFWNKEKEQWFAKEQYTKKNAKGKTIPDSGRVKLIPLDSPEGYIAPEGFRGTVIREGNLE